MSITPNGAKWKIKSLSDQAVVLHVKNVERVKEFIGSIVPNSPDDVRRRTLLASDAFNRLHNRNIEINVKLKVRLYTRGSSSQLQLSSPRHGNDVQGSRKIEAFEMRCLRTIFSVRLYE